MKSKIFHQCIEALKNNDHETVERLLHDFNVSLAEPAAMALLEEIRSRAQSDNVVARSAGSEPSTTIPTFLLSARDVAPPLPGISLVAACMNREENLLRVLDSWRATNVDEIIIVDWSSTEELWPKLAGIEDRRIRIIRIDGEKRWILTHALNVGLRFAAHELVVKVDCDIQLGNDFLALNTPVKCEFVRGFWKAGLEHGGEGQQYINGTFAAHKLDLRAVNYYDERIQTYGWDDSDLYMRLAHDLGLAGRLLHPGTLRHLDQLQEQRLGHQDVSKNRFLNRFEPTEFEGAKNKYYSFIAGDWNRHSVIQDYRIAEIGHRFFRGSRSTDIQPLNSAYYRLAETLAARDLSLWSFGELTSFVKSTDELDLDLSRLLRDAHNAGRSLDLVKQLTDRNKTFFIECATTAILDSLLQTLNKLGQHHPSFNEYLFLVGAPADTPLMEPIQTGTGNILVTSISLLEKLAERVQAKKIPSVEVLEKNLRETSPGTYWLSLSAYSIAREAIQKATRMMEGLGNAYHKTTSPVVATNLITSLYDEKILFRLTEYLACVVCNLKVFERIVIYYELSNGILQSVLCEILKERRIQPERITFVSYQNRPTFERLFSARALFPEGSMLAVANADIIFDGSLSKIRQIDMSEHFVVLSRRDLFQGNDTPELIRLDNGAPNIYSADAWIASTSFEADFRLDYLIGSFYCDSFINAQASKSKQYKIINPCLDINVFHLHDERLNSSNEKFRDTEAITNSYRSEMERNGGEDPVRGIAWTTIDKAVSAPGELHIQRWNNKALFFNLSEGNEPDFGQILLIHLLMHVVDGVDGLMTIVKLKNHHLKGPLGRLLIKYQEHFKCRNFLLDIVTSKAFDSQKSPGKVFARKLSFADLASLTNYEQLPSHMQEFLVTASVDSGKLIRGEFSGGIPTEATSRLCASLHEQESPAIKSFLEFFDTLPHGSAERRILVPFVVPQLKNPVNSHGTGSSKGNRLPPKVSLVTSLFKGGEFLPGYLENVFNAARSADGEVIIVDANADDSDAQIVRTFLDKHPKARKLIDYIKLERDPGLYECWKLGIERARAELISNANIDDRRCPTHTSCLSRILNEHADFSGACGSISCVKTNGPGAWFSLTENELWFYNEPLQEIGLEDLFRRNDNGTVMSRNVMHCMPVWRKCLHERYGYFDEEAYGTSADWAFWLKCARGGEKFIFEKSAFGRYYLNPASHNRRNDTQGLKELRIIEDYIGVSQQAIIKQ